MSGRDAGIGRAYEVREAAGVKRASKEKNVSRRECTSEKDRHG